MSTPWHAIRSNLMLSASTLRFHRSFETLRGSRASLGRFVDTSGMLDALHRGPHTSEEKNRILTDLVAAAQARGACADCALTLVLLALWPGLDAVLRRLKWRRVGTQDDLPSDLLARATEAVRRLDLGRVSSIAATILMNIERDLVRAHRRDVRARSLFADIDLDQVAAHQQQPDHGASREYLRDDLARVIAADADLVIRVAVDGYSQADAAVAFGLSEAAARKRYQRATARLRNAFQDYPEPMSRKAGLGGLCLIERP